MTRSPRFPTLLQFPRTSHSRVRCQIEELIYPERIQLRGPFFPIIAASNHFLNTIR
jgi:hypothetical protein